jgi:hypothetical protein
MDSYDVRWLENLSHWLEEKASCSRTNKYTFSTEYEKEVDEFSKSLLKCFR